MALAAAVSVPSSAYPSAPETLLKQTFIGKDVRDIDGPAAVLDMAVLRKNCDVMLQALDSLQVDFRAHVKTHKTTQVTRMQVGDDRRSEARVVVSTLQEAEQQAQLLSEYQKKGRGVNLLYGIPPSSTAYARLQRVRQVLGNDNVAFLIDNPAQLQNLIDPSQKTKEQVPVYVKIDVGCHRAGLPSHSQTLDTLLQAIGQTQETSGAPSIKLLGFYSYDSKSYGSASPEDCMQCFVDELDVIHSAAKRATELKLVQGHITLSVGGSPTTLSMQCLNTDSPMSKKVMATLSTIKASYNVEFHAGVYPFLDMQQLASRSRPQQSDDNGPTMTEEDLGLRILAEVLSVYTERDKPEALVGSGSLALGREPCKAYSGWGVVAPRPWQERQSQRIWDEEQKTGWLVGRISQEHGILEWHGPAHAMQPLKIGEKLLIWPNHACIASAGFDWFVVVDSSQGAGKETQIADVWMRCRGW